MGNWKKTVSMFLGVSLLAGTVGNATPITRAASETNNYATTSEYDYGDALQKSIMFYEFQKSGKLPEDQRNNWRGDSGLTDGADVGLDLTGGMYDCGDHVKFNLPMAYTSTMLAWSYLESTDIYRTTGQDTYLLDNIRWINDYLIKCHPAEDVYYCQVGDGGLDHASWTAAEVMQMKRPAYKVDLSKPGSAVCGEAAASLASGAIIYKDIDPEYAATCLKHAKELFSLAERMKSDTGYNTFAGAYYNSSHFYDELSWASMWIYRATDETVYLTKAKEYSKYWSKEGQTDNIAYTWAHCWDDVHYGAELLIAQYDTSSDSAIYKKAIENNLDYWSTGKNGERVPYTPKGLAWRDQWGSLRYSANQSFLASVYANWKQADPIKAESYKKFAKSQADYILGSSGRSFMVGYDETSPTQPHHRTAHGPWENNVAGAPYKARHVLVGALVGGPDRNDGYNDVITDFQQNEVGCDYNAGLVGLMASMYGEYGGTIDLNLNAFEEVGEELFVEAGINAQDKQNVVNFVELKAVVYNRTAWPARVTDQLSFRYFVDISDVLASGNKASDMRVTSSYSQHSAKVSQLKPWDIENGIYYVDIDLSGAKIYPGGKSEHKSEIQFRITAPGKWDYTKSPSFKDLSSSTSNSLVKSENIPLYDDGALVFGKEPTNGNESPEYKPTVEVTNPANDTVIDMSQEITPINLEANASIEEGNINKVVFYVNDEEVGTSSERPYGVRYTPNGTASKIGELTTYTIKAKAYADNGMNTVSKSITVKVQLPVSEEPFEEEVSIAILSPNDQDRYTEVTKKVKMTASAKCVNGTIDKVEFYADGKKFTELAGKQEGIYEVEYTVEGKAAEIGELTPIKFTAKAITKKGTQVSSKGITIFVQKEVQTTPGPSDIEIEVSNTNGASVTTNTLVNNFRIKNKKGKALDLSKLSIRYFYTSDGAGEESVWCDNVSITYNKAPWYVSYIGVSKGKIVRMNNKTDLADSYIEITFDSLDQLEEGAVLEAATRTAKNDWSNYDQSNDYSYGDNEKVAVYYDGVLIAGMEP